MAKRIFFLSLAVVVGVWLGVSIVMKKIDDSLLVQMTRQQQQMGRLQDKIAQKLGIVDTRQGLVLTEKTTDGDEVENQLKSLERRLNTLEKQWKDVKKGTEMLQQAMKQPSMPEEDYTKVHTIEIGNSFVQGPQEAPVTVVEFLDFQCPYSARFHPPLVEALKAFPNKVKYVVKNFPLPFHPQARPAAKAALAAGKQGKYWEMVDALLQNGQKLNEGTFKKIAEDLGLDSEKFIADYKNNDEEWEKLIKEDISLAREISVRGTPTFFINGRKTSAKDAETFKKAIEESLKEGKKTK